MPQYPSLGNVPMWRRPMLYGIAFALVTFVPGFVLGSLRNAEVLLLPRSLVEFLFPYSILPFEFRALLLLPQENSGLVRLDMHRFQPDVFTQQIFVAAFLSFFAVLLILTFQALAGAQDSRFLQQKPSAILWMLVVCEVFRELSVVALLLGRGVLSANLPTEQVVLPFVYFMAPLGLALFTSVVGLALWLLLATISRHAFRLG